MLKISTTATALAIAPVAASAQDIMPMLMLADCAANTVVKQFIYEEKREIPFSGGWGIMQTENLDYADGYWKIYASPDWGTFTVTIEFADGVQCIVGMGEDIQPFQDRSTR